MPFFDRRCDQRSVVLEENNVEPAKLMIFVPPLAVPVDFGTTDGADGKDKGTLGLWDWET